MESSTTRTLRDIRTPGAQQAISLPPHGQAGGEGHCRLSIPIWDSSRKLGVGVVGDFFFDVHIFEFTGLEDFATLQALHVFSFFITRDDLHARMLAGFIQWFVLRRSGRG